MLIKCHSQTKETLIELELDIAVPQQVEINTGLAFFDHMLDQLGSHARWQLHIQASGGIQVDVCTGLMWSAL